MTASFSDLGGDSGPIKLWMVLSLIHCFAALLLCCFALLGCRNLVVAYSLRSVEVKAASVRLFCPSARRPHRCFEAAIAIKNKGRPGCSYLCGSLSHLALRANISETSLVPLINEQKGEKAELRDEREFSWCCSFLWGFGCRGTKRRLASWRAAAKWSGSQSGRRSGAGFAAGSRSSCQTEVADLHS